MAANVEHQPSRCRFVLAGEGGEAELTYRMNGDVVIFDHTGVPPNMQHKGLANLLAEAGLGYAREEKLKVDPQCRFMAVYIKRHPEHQDLLR